MAVVFDIGNVLIEWQPEDYFDREYGEARRRALFDAVDMHGMNDRLDRGEPWAQVVQETAAAYPEFSREILDWHERWLEIAGPVIERSVRLLRALRRKGVPVLALTNFGAESFELAQGHYTFLNEFDEAYVSGRLGLLKPEAEIYAALEAGSGVAPGDLLFADDRADNVEAALARGWKAHLFDGPEGWAARLVADGVLTEEEAR
ncbi:MAG: HAD family phosphatase [Pseudomonadota bacterium]